MYVILTFGLRRAFFVRKGVRRRLTRESGK